MTRGIDNGVVVFVSEELEESDVDSETSLTLLFQAVKGKSPSLTRTTQLLCFFLVLLERPLIDRTSLVQ